MKAAPSGLRPLIHPSVFRLHPFFSPDIPSATMWTSKRAAARIIAALLACLCGRPKRLNDVVAPAPPLTFEKPEDVTRRARCSLRLARRHAPSEVLRGGRRQDGRQHKPALSARRVRLDCPLRLLRGALRPLALRRLP